VNFKLFLSDPGVISCERYQLFPCATLPEELQVRCIPRYRKHTSITVSSTKKEHFPYVRLPLTDATSHRLEFLFQKYQSFSVSRPRRPIQSLTKTGTSVVVTSPLEWRNVANEERGVVHQRYLAWISLTPGPSATLQVEFYVILRSI
jgi:hypothetical protein